MSSNTPNHAALFLRGMGDAIAEDRGRSGQHRWDVTYRWSVRRTYTVTAETATEALRLAAAEWANDADAPNDTPDDIECD